MREDEEYKDIFKFQTSSSNRITSRESSWLEFKESFNWNSKDKYAKSMAAFANNKGGFIVFGVKNNPRDLVGLQNDNFDNIDEAKITEYLNGVFSPEINFIKSTIKIRGKNVGLLKIYESTNKPIVCIKNDGEIKEAEIYYRYSGRSEKIKYPELKTVLEEIRSQERKSWMDLLKKISRVDPSNVSFDHESKSTGNKVASLRITDDPKAPAVRVEEEMIIKGYLNHQTLTKTLCNRYSDFKQNEKYHKLKNELKKNPKFCKIRHLDPNNPKSAQKCFYHPNIIQEFDKHYKLKDENK
jgi:hypothetical protein